MMASSTRVAFQKILAFVHRVIRGLMLLVVITIISSLLFGHLIYPSSPLLHETTTNTGHHHQQQVTDGHQVCNISAVTRKHTYHQRFRISLASTSFILATSMRTMFPRVIMNKMKGLVDTIEQFSHVIWEDVAGILDQNDIASSLPTTSLSYHTDPPELDLNMLVSCNIDQARMYLIQKRMQQDYTKECRLRDVITQSLLIEYVRRTIDEEFDLSTHPIILRNVWPLESFRDGERRLSLHGIMNDAQLSNVLLPNYFSDATKSGYDALVPDVTTEITLSNFVQGIVSGETPNAKIGTQVIIENIPELRDEIMPTSIAKELFGWSTYLEDAKEGMKKWMKEDGIGSWLIDKLLPPTSCYPVFIASNKKQIDADGNNDHPRTDLHMEPIGNMAAQLHGTRVWTLVPTKYSALLRPTVSKDRGYFYSNLDPSKLDNRLRRVPVVYKCTTKRGDVLWVPPWTWHRVDYTDENSKAESTEERLSIGASIFHFFPILYIQTNPLFSILIVPNLIHELLGWNVE